MKNIRELVQALMLNSLVKMIEPAVFLRGLLHRLACDQLSDFLLPMQPAQHSVCEVLIRTNSHKWILIIIIKRYETSMDNMVHNYANNVLVLY